MTLLAYVAHKRLYGIRPVGGDWREPAGSDANTLGVVAGYTVAHVVNALALEHRTDAHFVACVLRRDGVPERMQPRLTKASLAWLHEQGFAVSVEMLVADVDNEGHAPWASTDVAVDAAKDLVAKLGTVGVYVTAHGLRVLQPLSAPLTPEQAESSTRAWYLELEAKGIVPDWSCVDWTRHYRLPHVRRDGVRYRSPAVLLERMRHVTPPRGIIAPASKPKRGEPRFQGPVRDVDESPLARAFAAAGWAGQRIAHDRRAVRCPWESSHTGGATFDSSTVLFGPSHGKPRGWFWCSHAHCQGRAQREVIDALPPDARRHVWASGADAVPEPVAAPESLEAVSARLVDAIRHAPDGLSLIRAQCGLGKTHATRVVAAERAAEPGKLHTKTSISAPTNALAVQIARDLRAAGVPTMRVFGPLSVRRPDGAHECRYHAIGAALTVGGQSVRRELCEGRGRPCQYRGECAAVDGVDGPADARVVVGSHGLLGELDEVAGKTGLLAIDEPPALLDSVILTAADLDVAVCELGRFDRRYAAAMAPAMRAIRHWLDLGPVGEPGPLARAFELGVDQDLLTEAFEHTGETDVVAAVGAAFDVGHRGGEAPPIRLDESFSARFSPTLAERLGAASRVLLAVYRAIVRPESASAFIQTAERKGDDSRRLVITLVHESLERAVRRDGRCVVLAADAELHAPVLAKSVGYPPPVLAFAAPDGAEVHRAVLRTSSANRRGWMPHGRLNVGTIARALRGVVDWALESGWTGPVALVTYPLVEAAFAAALGRSTPSWPGVAADRDQAVAELGPILARLPSPPELGHYGALRGLDHWKHLDTLVTLGDPWPDLDSMAREIAFLGLDADRDARAEAYARAELEQAHGRLRLVHRTRPARLLHVGRLLPGGWADSGIEERDLPTGRPAHESPDAVDVRGMVAALGGAGAVARKLGVSRSTAYRWATGDNAPPPEAIEVLTRAAAAAGLADLRVSRKGLVKYLSPGVSGTPDGQIKPSAGVSVSPGVSGTDLSPGVSGTLPDNDPNWDPEFPDDPGPDDGGGSGGGLPVARPAVARRRTIAARPRPTIRGTTLLREAA